MENTAKHRPMKLPAGMSLRLKNAPEQWNLFRAAPVLS
jgi:hypothetical protein